MTLIYREVALDGTITDRPFTAEEIAENQAVAEQLAATNAQAAQEAAAKLEARAALLAKLGITDDEAKLLLS